jgi:hypothetical protein
VFFLQCISLSNVNFFPVCYFYSMFCASSKFEWCGVEEVGSGSLSYVKKDAKSKCRMVVFFIKIYKQVIFQHECTVSPVQSASGKALHCAWHIHRRNSSLLAYYSFLEYTFTVKRLVNHIINDKYLWASKPLVPIFQWLATCRWFSLVSSTNQTDRHYITEILLKVALNTIILTKPNHRS